MSAKINAGIQKQPPRHKSSTYRWLGIGSLLIAVIAELVILLVLRPSTEDLKWNLFGALLSFVFFFGVLYGEVAYPSGSIGGGLVALAYVIIGFYMLYLWSSLSKSNPDASDILIGSAFVGWGLGWGLFGEPLSRARKSIENAGLHEPVHAHESGSRMSPILSPSGVIPAASLCIITSAGIMLWLAFDLLVYPEYGGGITTIEGWANGAVVALPNLASIIVLFRAWKRMQVRYFMLSATLSAFSFAAPLAVLAEVALWRAHKKYGLPW